jgi:guanylate kinase
VEVEDWLRLERAVRRERKEAEPKYQELCRRFLSDSQDFSEENLEKAGIERRFSNNEEFSDCLCALRQFIESY